MKGSKFKLCMLVGRPLRRDFSLWELGGSIFRSEKELLIYFYHSYDIIFGVPFVALQTSKCVSWDPHLPAGVVLKYFTMESGEQYVTTTGE